MSATLQSLFPVTKYDGGAFVVYPASCSFTAGLTAGKYVFDGKTPAPVEFGRLLQTQHGIIAGVQFTANCSELDFTLSVDSPFELQILHGGNGTPVNMAPFKFCNFSQGSNFSLQWEPTGTTTAQEEAFLLQIKGKANQIFTLPQDALTLTAVFNFIKTKEKV